MLRTLAAAVILLATASEAAAATTMARMGYFHRFAEYWTDFFRKQGGITLLVVGIGIVSMFIITRGKWRK